MRKGKKESCDSFSSSSFLEMHEQLQDARRKLVEQKEKHNLALSRISNLEHLVIYLKNKDPALAEFMDSRPPPTAQGTLRSHHYTSHQPRHYTSHLTCHCTSHHRKRRHRKWFPHPLLLFNLLLELGSFWNLFWMFWFCWNTCV